MAWCEIYKLLGVAMESYNVITTSYTLTLYLLEKISKMMIYIIWHVVIWCLWNMRNKIIFKGEVANLIKTMYGDGS
jgi:hypothetical protein